MSEDQERQDRMKEIRSLIPKRLQGHLDAMEALMEASAELTGNMMACTCAAHMQLKHYSCVHDPVIHEVMPWLHKNMMKVVKGVTTQEEFMRDLVMFTEKRTVKHLEIHVADFTDPMKRKFE